MSETWRIEMLGGLRAHGDGRTITRFRTEKTASLFAFLAFHSGHEYSRDFLADLLWPDSEGDAGRHNLRNALSSLRQQFSDCLGQSHILIADRKRVSLDPSAFILDVADFEALVSKAGATECKDRAETLAGAVELYRGEFLEGLYESWIPPHQRRLQDLFVRAAVDLASDYERMGEHAKAGAAAALAAEVDPLCEDAQIIRLRSAMAIGNRSAAGRLYRGIEEVWRAQLDEPPPDAIRSLRAALPIPLSSSSSSPSSSSSAASLRPQSAAAVPRPPHAILREERPSGDSTAFVGRRDEMDALTRLLAPPMGKSGSEGRVITLTGTGGIGKTRLAQRVLDGLVTTYNGNGWYVPLAGIRRADRIPGAIGKAMGPPAVKDVPPVEAVVLSLAGKPSLLVLDNFEQLLPGGKEVIRELVRQLPGLTCVVTSRTLLGVEQERDFPVSPLPVPSGREVNELLALVPSVELFVRRAQAARPGFRLTEKNSRAVAEICRRLEGLPLAIELAAARSYSMTPMQILERLSDRYQLLSGRSGTLEERHRSLRAAVAWSCDLLGVEARSLAYRLSVFRRGWTEDAAAALCGRSSDCGALLDELCRSSMIAKNSDSGDRRYSMLETLRDYCAAQLDAAERELATIAHLDYFVRLAEDASALLSGSTQKDALELLSREQENLQAALGSAAAMSPEKGLRIAGAVWRHWLMQGNLSEGREHLDLFLRLTSDSPGAVRAKALFGAGVLAAEQSDYNAARSLFEERLCLVKQMDDPAEESATLNALGNVHREMGRYPEARDYYDHALDLRRRLGDKTAIAATMVNLASVLHSLGAFEEALRLSSEGLELTRETGDLYGQAASLENMGISLRALGDAREAMTHHQESLRLSTQIGNRHGMAGALHNLASAAWRLGRTEDAKEHVLDALALNRAIGHPAWEAYNLDLLSAMEIRDGQMEAARSHARDALMIRRQFKEPLDVASSLDRIAAIDAAGGDRRRAALLMGAAIALRCAAAVVLPDDEERERVRALEDLVQVLGADTADQMIVSGERMTMEEAIALALAE